MSKVTLDKTTNVADVQAGARLEHVATELYKQGKRAFSHGTCPGVGVGGHSLHGGFGFSSHTYGLAVDWIAAATVVLANSTVVTASPTENPDLFWALRGAGSNFLALWLLSSSTPSLLLVRLPLSRLTCPGTRRRRLRRDGASCRIGWRQGICPRR
ncbi:hypothetical protein QBC45DRAFT_102386 [Copromyces sp. CBS 386.78]|nr:hypothetical protein QBC45DRAFT_102386 [Copromyces sp. CBS 386.78]